MDGSRERPSDGVRTPTMGRSREPPGDGVMEPKPWEVYVDLPAFGLESFQ